MIDQAENKTREVLATRAQGNFDLIFGVVLIVAAIAAGVFSVVSKRWIMLAIDALLIGFGVWQLSIFFRTRRLPKELIALENGVLTVYDAETGQFANALVSELAAVDADVAVGRRSKNPVIKLFFKRKRIDVYDAKDAAAAVVRLRALLLADTEKKGEKSKQ